MQTSVAPITIVILSALFARPALGDTVIASVAVDAQGRLPNVAGDALLYTELERNVEDHERECTQACTSFYCGPGAAIEDDTRWDRYSMGPVPSNDLPAAFADSNQIYVSEAPLFSPEECDEVIAMAEREGDGLPSSKSGKYQLGKAWIKDMPSVLSWFNGALEKRLWPTLMKLFPDVVGDASSLRAHSVAILKYNASHPRTDVHVDDALLAFTIALSRPDSFEGGGTYFEHIGRVIDMDQGHATFRPGSVRHAGSTVHAGLRYVVGGFIAVSDKVEHVRRLNERGNRILLQDPGTAELEQAGRLFEWAIRLNGQCSLCHQNMADVHLRLDRPQDAEKSSRTQIQLLPKDSDAYFALGVSLRAQSRNGEAGEAYKAALAIQPNDYETRINLAAVLAEAEDFEGEAENYQRALELRPHEAKAWLNLGISYNAQGRNDLAEETFQKASVALPNEALVPLTLAKMYAKLDRPAEAIDQYYGAAVLNSEYFDEVKLGVGTARAQQGRLAEATVNFESASRMAPKNKKLADALVGMRSGSQKLAEASADFSNAVADVCGTPCQDIVDTNSYNICAVTWGDGCGDAPPPAGFDATSTVADLCRKSCAAFVLGASVLAPASD